MFVCLLNCKFFLVVFVFVVVVCLFACLFFVCFVLLECLFVCFVLFCFVLFCFFVVVVVVVLKTQTPHYAIQQTTISVFISLDLDLENTPNASLLKPNERDGCAHEKLLFLLVA